MTTPHEYHWVFGNRDHLEFPNGGDPIIVADAQLQTNEGCSTISDANGNLVAYTDGIAVWDSSNFAPVLTGLGGNISTTQSGLILPPIQGGQDYHVFSVSDDFGAPDQIIHATFTLAGPSIAQVLPAAAMTGVIAANYDNTERLAATSHASNGGYWLVAQSQFSGRMDAFLVDSDAMPTVHVTSMLTQIQDQWEVGYMKFSPDGTMLAWADYQSGLISVNDFDNNTGIITERFTITGFQGPYGLEFSPDSQIIYVSDYGASELRGFPVSQGQSTAAATILLHADERLAALQLGPNGKIYAKRQDNIHLLSLDTPNNLGSPTVVEEAVDASGQIIELNLTAQNFGLPNFVRIVETDATTDIDSDCSQVAGEVNDQLSQQQSDHFNQLATCDADMDASGNPIIVGWTCEPADVPTYRPHISISWGDSDCDCIENDDTEIMSVTICNPYSNVDLSSVTANRLRVVDIDGNPVPVLPDGTNSVQLVPVGPYCFGNIPPCSCVSREFILRNRGAMPGTYRIMIEGLCFDVNNHISMRECFTFDICKD